MEYLHHLSIKPNTAEPFYKFSLKTIQEINRGPLKLTLKEPDETSQIPLPILGDPFLWINVDFILEESKNYQFEVFKFYQTVNQEVKY